jgi:hypothetical protein
MTFELPKSSVTHKDRYPPDVMKETIESSRNAFFDESGTYRPVATLNNNSEFLRRVTSMNSEQTFEVSLITMNYRIPYGYELNPEFYDFVYTPVSKRMLFNLVAVISTNSGALIAGRTLSGKRRTFKVMDSITVISM